MDQQSHQPVFLQISDMLSRRFWCFYQNPHLGPICVLVLPKLLVRPLRLLLCHPFSCFQHMSMVDKLRPLVAEGVLISRLAYRCLDFQDKWLTPPPFCLVLSFSLRHRSDYPTFHLLFFLLQLSRQQFSYQ